MSDENKRQDEKEYSDLLNNYSGEYLKEHKDENSEGIPANRQEKVKNFSLNFDADTEIPDEAEPGSHDKGIYFAAYAPKEKKQEQPPKKPVEK